MAAGLPSQGVSMAANTLVVRNTASGHEADFDFLPGDTVQDLHDFLLSEGFLNSMGSGAVGGSYEFTLMPESRQLRPDEHLAKLSLTQKSFVEVSWAMNAGGLRS